MPVEDADGVWVVAEVFAALDSVDVAHAGPSRLVLEKHPVPVADKALGFCQRKGDLEWFSASSLT
jgi:hypothetical protein